jgi:hypothetical protein
MPKRLSPIQTYRLWGGLSSGTRILPGIIAMDVTKAGMQIEPDLEATAKVATVHLSHWHALAKPDQLKRNLLKARHQLMRHGFTHVAITGPLAGLALTRMPFIGMYKNARSIAMLNLIPYLIVLLGMWLAAMAQSTPRRKRLQTLLSVAHLTFAEHYIFDLCAPALDPTLDRLR